MGSQDEELSQVFVPTSAGPGELLLAPGGVLARYHSQPGSKPAALFEGCPIADGRDRGRSDQRSNSGNRDQAPAWFKFAGDAHDQLVGFPESVCASTASLSAVVSEALATHLIACCLRLPGCGIERLQDAGVL